MKFTKHDSLKSRLDLLPPRAIELVGIVLRHGALKYAEHNWKNCQNPEQYVGAALRHLMRHLDREVMDPESKFLHLAHAACSVLFALDLFVRLEHNNEMAYFGVVRHKSKTRAVVIKRFRTFEKAWIYFIHHKLPFVTHSVKPLRMSDKLGHLVKL